jgi:hypothetical protein
MHKLRTHMDKLRYGTSGQTLIQHVVWKYDEVLAHKSEVSHQQIIPTLHAGVLSRNSHTISVSLFFKTRNQNVTCCLIWVKQRSFSPRTEHKLSVNGNIAVDRTHGPEGTDIMGKLKKPNTEKHRNLHSLHGYYVMLG